ncbi:hypothetical protein OG558_01645 [Kribbella sp. NBC_01510]|uniref:hypothetical protein n=1 Tax=Kribbella sp. NBC_01510 TaxID=2903581 RepID=UPI00386A319E
MNPTDEVDDLLTRAGARWRADQPSPPEPDLDHILGGGRRPRRWVPALAAASVAAIAAAALTVLPDGGKQPAPPNGTSQSFAQGNKAPYDDLLVRDGDQVTATGRVIVAPGREPVFCARLPMTDIGFTGGKEPAPTCEPQYAVTLKDLDPARLADAKTIEGVRIGYAVLIGTWTGRTIDVRDQTVPTHSPTAPQIPPDQVPCPAPAGGWKTAPNNYDKVAISRFLETRQDQATDPRVQYPKGQGPGAPEVYTIGVAHGDLATFRNAFEKVYGGNLCVHQVKFSEAELMQRATAVGNLIPKGVGVYMGGGSFEEDKVGVSALVYDEALKTALTPIGLDDLKLEVAVKPVR